MIKRKLIHPRLKQKILERDNFKCVNCGISGDFSALEVDHILSVKDGGSNDENNLQTLCYRCNMEKYYKKNITNKFLLNLSPLERLELIKNRLNDYKHLSIPEFKVIFTQDELFKRLRLNLLYLMDLFLEISGKIKENKQYLRYNTTFDKYIRYLYDNLQLSQEEVGKIGGLHRETILKSLKRTKKYD
jgi:hypothetical protein